MNKKVLSIKQMQHLKELGVDTGKASMIWRLLPECFRIPEEHYVAVRESSEKEDEENIPAFSLQDMLSMMPHTIDDDCNLYVYFHDEGVSIYYEDFYEHQPAFYSGDNIIDMAYEMLCWLAENDYLNKNKR